MSILLSVILPTHNPNHEILTKTLNALRLQSLNKENWELIIVDNASKKKNILTEESLSWHPNVKVIREERLGLTWARIAGINNSCGELIVFTDDDNILSGEYLGKALNLFKVNLDLGVIGGLVSGEFEKEPEEWFWKTGITLGLQNFGKEIRLAKWKSSLVVDRYYPDFSPIGAGMVIRARLAREYVKNTLEDKHSVISDRVGNKLSSGGDNDIVLFSLLNGWQVGYSPELKLKHLIPSFRLRKDYLAKLNHDSSKSWVLVLNKYNIRIWRKISRFSLIPRKLKFYFVYKAWKGASEYIRWRGVCGTLEGLAYLKT